MMRIFRPAILLVIGFQLFAENTGFEIQKDGKVKGWTSWSWAPNKQAADAKMSCEAAKGANSSNVLRIEVNKEKHVGVWCNTPARINAIPGEKYILNVKVLSETEQVLDCKVSAGFTNLKWKAEKGNGVSKTFQVLPKCGWQKLSLPVTIPEKFNYARIDVELRTPGVLLISDVSFELQSKISAVPGVPYLLCGKAEKAPVIDGVLDDKCWNENIECSNFLLTQNKGMAQGQSSAWITYDAQNIYFALRCEEKFLNPVFNQMDRFKDACKDKDGPVWTDDSVEIFIKNESGKKYQIIANSLGTVYDSILNDKDKGLSWDARARTAAKVAKGSWSLEISVPISSLGVDSVAKLWRINLCRTRQPIAEFSSWSPAPKGFHDDNYWGYVEFTDKVPGIKTGSLVYKNKKSLECDVETNLQSSASSKVDLHTGININNKYQWDTTELTASENGIFHIRKNLPEVLNTAVCRYADFEYSFLNENRFLYKSPVFRFKIGNASSVVSSFLGKLLTGDETGIKELKDVFIPEGETEEIVLALNSSKCNELPEKIEFVMDMPFSCSLISPMHSRNSTSPLEFKETLISRDNTKYRQYRMIFPRQILTDSDGPEWEIVPIHFFLKMNGSDKNINEGKIYFHSYVPELKYTEEEHSINLKALPPFCRKKVSGKLPFIIWPWWPFYSVTQHGEKERESIFEKWENAGLNTVSAELQLNAADYRKLLHEKYKFNLAKMMPVLMSGAVPGAREYLAKHPGEKEITLSGKTVDSICFADLLEGKSAFIEEFSKVIGNMAKVYQVLHIDYEYGIFGNNSPGYSKRNIEMFRRKNNISEKEELNNKSLMGKYRQQWVEFRCWQNGETFKIYKDAIKKSNPDCIFGAYSAYQREGLKRENYGNDWRYLGKYVDLVMCGYGRGDYKATQEASGKGKIFNGGEGIWGKDYDTDRTEINLFRRLTDSGSFMIFYNGIDDGNVYEAVSKVIGVASDFEDFFTPLKRADDLIEIENIKDVPSDPVSVLLNPGGERLVFIFNESDKEKKFVINNKNLPENFKAVDYLDKKVLANAARISCNILPGKIKIIYLCQDADKNPPVPKTLIPDAKNLSLSERPVFIWEDNGKTNSYSLECREKGKSETLKKLDGLKENFSWSDLLLKPGLYEWRVSAKDIISKKQSAWTAWAAFTVPAILNADIIPGTAAQGENIIFTADFPAGGDWLIDLIDSTGNKIKSIKGKGNKIDFKFDGKTEKGILKEGSYNAVFYGNCLMSAEMPFSIDNKISRRNSSIENLGIWNPMHWGGYETLDDKLYLAKDYDVTHSNSYSLRIIKPQHGDPFWCNYHRYPSGTRMIKVTPGEKYKFSAWVKNSGEKVKGKISISYCDENKYPLPGASALLTGEKDWTLVSVISTVPAGAVRLSGLGISSSGGTGTSWFDSFKLEKLEQK
ncbi:MAG: hypothetical protein A2017_00595 [Lentisphaerae bacterium GWF2_44_16]|nr:MAG: hypothetical protein A2017_00595 [Lentisphaerae bacterium GWF2_44_16]